MHGYYTQDWTTLDANMGGEADLRALVDGAPAPDIRILTDVVMNHAGYATLADAGVSVRRALFIRRGTAKRILLSAIAGQTGDPPPDKSWHSFSATTSAATAPHGKMVGKSGFVPILATTTVRDLTI